MARRHEKEEVVVEEIKEEAVIAEPSESIPVQPVVEEIKEVVSNGKGFIQNEIDSLDATAKGSLGIMISDFFGSGLQKETIVSLIVNTILDKVSEINPEAKETLGAIAQSIFDSVSTQAYQDLISEYDSLNLSNLAIESKLSIMAQGLDNFASKLG